jgi:hypothetical protein
LLTLRWYWKVLLIYYREQYLKNCRNIACITKILQTFWSIATTVVGAADRIWSSIERTRVNWAILIVVSVRIIWCAIWWHKI